MGCSHSTELDEAPVTDPVRAASPKVIGEPKLSVVPKGVWRNHFTASVPHEDYEPDDETTNLSDGTYLSGFWPSKEVAEQRAREAEFDEDCLPEDKYLGAVFFPAGDQ